MNKLILIESVLKEKKESANQLVNIGILQLYQKVAAALANKGNCTEMPGEDDYIKQNTADFPVKFLTHGLLEEISPKNLILSDPNHPDYLRVL